MLAWGALLVAAAAPTIFGCVSMYAVFMSERQWIEHGGLRYTDGGERMVGRMLAWATAMVCGITVWALHKLIIG